MNLPVEVPDDGRAPVANGTLRVKGRTRQAIDLMVWQGKDRRAAAAQVGLNPRSLSNAFLLPSVRAYYTSQLDVLRSTERARNIHRLVEIRDAANNMPAVNAIKTLEQIDDTVAAGPMNRAPGLQIVVIANGPQTETAASHVVPSAPVIEHGKG